ncbi:MAG: succinyl-CoA synthetase subunit alpha [Rhodospirillales bacterium]|nr:succinyl-CoA synthetase subunit alpha [Rhodospirillales bacterium]
MIIRRAHRVLVQGITGRQGTFWAEKMIEYGTRVAGGVNPKKAGETHLGLPVFASAVEAAKDLGQDGGFDVVVQFVPPLAARSAALDAIAAGAKLIVMLTEHIPAQDVMYVLAAAKAAGTQIVGPNTAGLVTPGECFVGIMPAFNRNVFRPGRVGVISRSGSLGTQVCLDLTRAGLGQSAFIGVGGDAIVGTTSRDALEILAHDPGTDAVVLVGEIGGAAEETAAQYAATMTKPVVAFIAGRSAPVGKRMGHAGAIVLGARGTYDSKRRALEAAGVEVLDLPSGLAPALARALACAGPSQRTA